ncbi:MAG: methyltransferase [Bacteroidales bacterium]|nr:methyltransferase [Bacteroidales bacterium]
MEENIKYNQLLAKTLFGLEQVLADELKAIGADDIELLKRAVSFTGDKEIMYRANYCCRTALRVLKPIAKFKVNSADELYNNVKRINWPQYLDLNGTFAIDETVGSSVFLHTKFVALKAKDAIADRFRMKFGKRPSVDVKNPDLRINIHIYKDDCTISIDSSGDPLYKRGYRILTDKAPINEILAAGMVLLSGWEKDCNFIDPMCGSGTILIEAAMIANNISPGIFRHFGFEKWNDFDKKLWKKITEDETSKQCDFKFEIVGSDRSYKAIEIARQNLKAANLQNHIILFHNSIEKQTPPKAKGIMITNPPYGERMEVNDQIELYKKIGDSLKKNYAGYSAWLISSDFNALKYIGLRPSRRIALYNGQLECRYLRFDIYEGSKKQKYNIK